MAVMRASRVAHLLAAIALGLDALAVLLLLPQAGTDELTRMDSSTFGGYVLGVAFPVVGWLIATRRPGNAIGWIFMGIGLSQALDTFAGQYGVVGLVVAPGSLPAADVASWIAVWSWAPGFVLLLTAAVLRFPDGRLPTERWRPVEILAGVALLLLVVPIAVVSWPYRGATLLAMSHGSSSDPVVSMAMTLELLGLIVLAVAGVGSIVGLGVRFRRSRGIERAQLKWFVAGGTVEVVALLGSAFLPTQGGPLDYLVTLVVSPLVPIAATIAILRYRLYDIDRLVSRTVSYAAITGLLAVLFAGLVVALQGVLATIAENSAIAVALSTLVVAAAFQPLRSRVQRPVDRRFNRARYDADRMATGFAGRVRDQVDAGAVIGALGEAVERTVQPVSTAVWIRRWEP